MIWIRYEEAKAQGKDSYDRELEECLEKHILECDRKIARALKRLEDDDVGAATAIAVSEVTKVLLKVILALTECFACSRLFRHVFRLLTHSGCSHQMPVNTPGRSRRS